MAFDPARIPDDSCVDGHLDVDAVYDVLASIHAQKVTGRLTVEDGSGPNHMYFMQGKPVGVGLAEYVHPLGQLLLELGRVNGQTFVRAQRLIAEGNRLAGQVFKELGVLDDDSLRDVLAIQARKKAEHFCRLGSRPFSFCRGLTYLMGFTTTPLDIWVVIYLAIRAQLGPDARAAWIDGARELQVRIQNAPGDEFGLPAPLSAFGFGVAEERFLLRVVGGWEKVSELCDTGTLPADEAAVLLRFLEVINRLDKRPAPTVPATISALIKQPREVQPLAVPEGLDDVFESSQPLPAAAGPANVPAPISGPNKRAPGPAAPTGAPPASPVAMAAGVQERTDPRRKSIHDENTVPIGEVAPEEVQEVPAAARERPRFRSVLFPEPEQQAPPPPPSVIVSEELPPPVVRKKKVKRSEPLPSEGTGVLVSETRKEKTNVTPMPTIVIEDE